MKKTVVFLLSALAIAGVSFCKKTKDEVNKALQFDIPYSTMQTIPGASVSVSGPAEFVTPNSATESASTFKKYNTSPDLVDEIKMTKFTITNQGGNLDFLKSISVYIRATGLADVLVANKNDVPKGSTSVNCDMSGANIKQHIFKDSIRFRIGLFINNTPSTDQLLKLDETVNVSGKVF
jgi:hypothetical protein